MSTTNDTPNCAVRHTRSHVRRNRLLAATAAALFAASTASAVVSALDTTDRESTPRESPSPSPSDLEALETPEELAAKQASAPGEAPLTIANKVTVGIDMEISRLFTDSGFIPPDTMGAVGPDHIVEMINGNFEIFDKTTGASVETRSLASFVTNRAGLAIVNTRVFDPRIVFDPASGRWFAAVIDDAIDADDNGVNETSNNFYVMRSDTEDPTGDWDGVVFDADTQGAEEFHDYETLAVDADGLYMCTQDFDGGGNESCYSIPKVDLLQAAPSAANLTRFEATPAGLPAVSGSIQPALDFGLSDGRAALLGSTGTVLRRTDIFGAAGAGATLGTPVAIAGDPGHAAPPDARQPQDTDAADTETIENVAPRFVGNVFELDDSLWAVHAVQGSGSNSALRWYEIDETTNTVLQTGLIDDPTRDFHEPSIAVNPLGNVVIGYTCSGPNLAASVCVSVGETTAGVTTFEAPAILFTGAGIYHRDFRDPATGLPNRNRWGDYSATVIDPVDSCTFWSFQEYVAVGGTGDVGPAPDSESGLWGTRVAELTFDSCAEADLSITKTDSPDPVAASGELVYTLRVQNAGPSKARDVVVTDTLPVGTQFVSAGGPNWSCVHAAGTVNCEWQGGNPVGSLAAGQEANPIQITVHVDDGLVDNTGTALITDQAKVESKTDDPNTSNNMVSASTTVLPGCGGQLATIVGSTGGDNIFGTAGNDVIATLAGSDNITGARGNDKICSGSGSDNVSSGPGNDFVDGGSGDDNISAGAGNDTVDGGPGTDTVSGGPGTDTCINAEFVTGC